MDNYGKFGQKLLLWNNVPFSLISDLGIRTRQIMPGDGDFCFVFSTRGSEFGTEKLSRGRGF